MDERSAQFLPLPLMETAARQLPGDHQTLEKKRLLFVETKIGLRDEARTKKRLVAAGTKLALRNDTRTKIDQ